MNLAMQPCAIKSQRAALPFASEIMLLGKLIGRFLYASLRFCHSQRMGSNKAYIGHAVSFAIRHRPAGYLLFSKIA